MYTSLDGKLLREVAGTTLFFPMMLITATTAAQIGYGYIAPWYVALCTTIIGVALWIGGAHIKHVGLDYYKATVLLFGSSGMFIALAAHTILQKDAFFLGQNAQIVIIVLAIAFALITYNMGHTAARYYTLPFFAFEEKHTRAIEALSAETIMVALLLIAYFFFIG